MKNLFLFTNETNETNFVYQESPQEIATKIQNEIEQTSDENLENRNKRGSIKVIETEEGLLVESWNGAIKSPEKIFDSEGTPLFKEKRISTKFTEKEPGKYSLEGLTKTFDLKQAVRLGNILNFIERHVNYNKEARYIEEYLRNPNLMYRLFVERNGNLSYLEMHKKGLSEGEIVLHPVPFEREILKQETLNKFFETKKERKSFIDYLNQKYRYESEEWKEYLDKL